MAGIKDIKNRALGKQQEIQYGNTAGNTGGNASNKGSAMGFAKKYGILPTTTEQPDAKETYKGLYETASKLKNPRTLNEVFENIGELPRDLPESRMRYYKEAQQEFSNLAKEAQREYQKNSKAIGWAQIGELVGQALTRFAAAKEGMSTGVDLSSGLKFQPTDWQAKQSQLFKEMRSELDSIRDQSAKLGKEESDERGRFDRERGRVANAQFAQFTAMSENKWAKQFDRLLNNAERSATKFSKQKESYTSKLTNLREQLEEDAIDEDKYNKEVGKVLERVAKDLGVTNEELSKAKDESKDRNTFWNSILNTFGAGDEIKAPVQLEEWLANRPEPVVDEDVRAALKVISNPATPPEERSEYRKALRALGFSI